MDTQKEYIPGIQIDGETLGNLCHQFGVDVQGIP